MMPVPEIVEGSPLSSAAAAAFFLFWQEPTDRALIGWSAYGGFILSMGREKLEPWLSAQLGMTGDEFAVWQRRGGISG